MAQIGVVIPAWNAEAFLADSIESVLAQSFGDWRLVIVDDGSTDGTRALAQKYERRDGRISMVAQSNGGLSAARNAGLAVLAHDVEYVLFLDADDLLEPDGLRLLLAAATAQAGAVGAHGLPREVDEHGRPAPKRLDEAWGYVRRQAGPFRARALQPHENTDFAALVIWPCIETAGQVLIKNAALDSVGEWRSMPGEDWDMWLRLAALGPFAYVPHYVMSKRERGDSLSRDGKWLARAEPMIRTMLASDEFTPSQRRVARMGHLLSCWVKATWVRDDLRAHRWETALRNAYRAGRSSVRFALVAHRY